MPRDLQRRHVEIAAPVNRKMIINALNSGADTFMADFEDSLSPTWKNIVQGHADLMDVERGSISFQNEDGIIFGFENSKPITLLGNPLLVFGRPLISHDFV